MPNFSYLFLPIVSFIDSVVYLDFPLLGDYWVKSSNQSKLNSIWSSMYIFKWMCLLNSQLIKYLTYFISQLLFFFFFPSRMAPHCALSLSVMQLATSPPSAMATILILWPTPAHPRPLFSALSVETAPNSPSTSPNK